MKKAGLVLALGAVLLFGQGQSWDGSALGKSAAQKAGTTTALSGWASGVGGDPDPALDTLKTAAYHTWGPSQLPALITLGTATDLPPAFRYVGTDVTTTSWPADGYGDDLAATGSGDPTVGVGGPFTDGSGGVDFASGGKSFGEASDNDGALANGDMVIEAVVDNGDGTQSEDYIVSRYQTSTTPYWMLYTYTGGTALRFIFHDGTTAKTCSWTSALHPTGATYIALVIDRSIKAVLYVNGEKQGATCTSLPGGSINRSATAFQVGSFASSSATHSGVVRYVAAYHQASAWLTTADVDSWAAERFGIVSGARARDEAADGDIYAEHDRNSGAWARICDPDTDTTKAYRVGYDWTPREFSCSGDWSDPAGTDSFSGPLVEDDVTNLALHSADLTNAAWTAVASSVTADQGADLFGGTSMDRIDGTVADAEHGVSQAITLTAADHTWSVYATAGNQDHAYLDVSTVTNAWAYFDLLTCTVTSEGLAGRASAQDFGGGLCRLTLGFIGTAASHTARALCAAADGDKDYVGASGDCELGNAQLSNTAMPGQYVATTTTSATKGYDGYAFTMTPRNPDQSTHLMDGFFQDDGFEQAANTFYFSNTDGYSAAERLDAYYDYSGSARIYNLWYDGTTNTTAYQVADLNDAERHILRVITDVATTTGTVCVDGACGENTTSSLNTVGADYDKVTFSSRTFTAQPFANVWRFRIYDEASQ